MTRILMANALFPPDRTGSAVFTAQLAEALVERGHDVIVVTSSLREPSDGDHPTVRVERLSSRRVSVGRLAWNYSIPLNATFGNYRRLIKLIGDFQPETVICHGQIFDLTWMLCRMAKRLGVRPVVVFHTAIWNENRLRRAVLRAFERLVIAPFLRGADSIYVAVDKWTYNDAKRRIARKQTVSVIPISVDIEYWRNSGGSDALEKYGISGRPVILSLGHVVALRNRVALVRALPTILESFPQAVLVVVGEIKDDGFLSVASDARVKEHIICLGSVKHSEIRNLLKAADVEAHDLQGLGLGITSVEAMASGVPIVAWASDDNYPGLSLRSYKEIGFIDDGDPETISREIIDLLANEQRRSEACLAQSQLVDDVFDSDSVASRYEAVFSH